MKEIIVDGIKFKTDCDNLHHLKQVLQLVVENLNVLELRTLDDINFIIYKKHKVVNVIGKKPINYLKLISAVSGSHEPLSS